MKSHPGLLIKQELDKRGITQREFASILGMSFPQLSNILKGKRNINVNICLVLENIGIYDAKFWMDINSNYLIAEAKGELDENISGIYETWNSIKELLPINYLKKHLNFENNINKNVNEVFELFDVLTVGELKEKIESYTFKGYRKNARLAKDQINMVTWSLLAEKTASNIKVNTFNAESKSILIEELRKIFFINQDTFNKCQKLLFNHGISLFTLDRPSKTPIQGKCFVTGKTPTIALTLKYSRLDNFAFNLMHELGHVFNHLFCEKYKSIQFLTNERSQENEAMELEADKFAQDALIEYEKWLEFFYKGNFTDDAIMEFAMKEKIHPAIIRGRVCHNHPEYYRKRTKINNLNKLR